MRAEDKKPDDAKQIVGKWKRVELHVNGEVRKEFDRELILTFTKEAISAKIGDREVKVKYKLDPTKTPKHIDQTAKRNGQEVTRKAIYSLKGDTLKICGPRRSAERPGKFEAKGGNTISVFKRVKAKEK